MSIDSRIVAALEPLGYECEHGTYTGKDTTYFTFNYQTLGADFGDDAPGHERVLVQVHLYTKLNVNLTALKTKVKQYLFAADFTWPDVTDVSDENWRHFEFTCETVQGVTLEVEDPDEGATAHEGPAEEEEVVEDGNA